MPPSGRTTSIKGARAEQAAEEMLRERGYQILSRNFRCRGGEIDIIARDGAYLCFVEVRSLAHTQHGHPLETITRAKQQKIILAARHYLARHGGENQPIRFDVVAIVDDELELLQGAFEVTGY